MPQTNTKGTAMPWSFLAWHHEKLHEIADGPVYLPEHITSVTDH